MRSFSRSLIAGARRWALLGVALVGGGASGCTTAPHQVSSENFDPAAVSRTYGDLLVVGVYDDQGYRAGSESAFAQHLIAHGIQASPSYDLIPRLNALESNEAIAQALDSSGHDGILVVATLDEGYDYEMEDYYATRGMVYLLGGGQEPEPTPARSSPGLAPATTRCT